MTTLPTALPLAASILGDFTQSATRLIAVVPDEWPAGTAARAVVLMVEEDLERDPYNSWVLQFIATSNGRRGNLTPEISLAGGLVAGFDREIPFTSPMQVDRGTRIAARLETRGDAPPIVGLSLCLIWSSLAMRRNARA